MKNMQIQYKLLNIVKNVCLFQVKTINKLNVEHLNTMDQCAKYGVEFIKLKIFTSDKKKIVLTILVNIKNQTLINIHK